MPPTPRERRGRCRGAGVAQVPQQVSQASGDVVVCVGSQDLMEPPGHERMRAAAAPGRPMETHLASARGTAEGG